MAEVDKGARSKWRASLSVALRVIVTVGVFGYLFTRIDMREVGAAFGRIPAWAAATALGSQCLAVLCGVLRWRVLARAARALYLPSWPECIRQYLVAMFYNLLPGALGGDVLRGYATRKYFEEGAAVRSVGVVFVERVCGFAGLLVLAASATLTRAQANRLVLLYSGLGLCAAFGAVIALALGRRVRDKLPAVLARHAASLPEVESPRALGAALVLSVLTHALLAVTGYSVLVSLTPVSLGDGMSIFPLGTLAAYFPLTIAGAGARDTALVVLLSELGVSRADALATSLSILACSVIVAALGGLVQLRAKAHDDDGAAAG
jgi:uncharacterized membrane protein YbhN (UPF0104 family)